MPSEPRSLEIVSANSSSVTLKWRPPVTPNGVITNYSLQYDAKFIDSFGNSALDMLMDTVGGLSLDTVYVCATTDSKHSSRSRTT